MNKKLTVQHISLVVRVPLGLGWKLLRGRRSLPSKSNNQDGEVSKTKDLGMSPINQTEAQESLQMKLRNLFWRSTTNSVFSFGYHFAFID